MSRPNELVLLRHGESTWNLENRFSGWTDVPLTAGGEEEAESAGLLMAEEGLSFDIVHTSLLRRAINTANIALDRMDLHWLPISRNWRLNERHYGGLQGLNKKETAALHGADQVFQWRRSYGVPPPALERDDPRHPASTGGTGTWPPASSPPPNASPMWSLGPCPTGKRGSCPTCQLDAVSWWSPMATASAPCSNT